MAINVSGRGTIPVEGIANAKALGQKHASGVYKEQQGGQCGFNKILEKEISRKWGQKMTGNHCVNWNEMGNPQVLRKECHD